MADTANTTSTLDGLFLDVIGDGPIRAPANFAWFQKEIPFSERGQSGGVYRFPVVLTNEHGVTRSKANNGAFTINDSVAAELKDAQVEPSQLLLKSVIDYESAFRARDGGKRAFEDAVGLVVKNMVQAIQKHLELDFLYGRTGWAVEASSASTSIVINEEHWSPATFSGMKGARVQVINADFEADEDTDETIASVNLGTRTLVVGNAQTLDAGDLLFFYGSVTSGASDTEVHHSMVGIDEMTTHTTGTLFNISSTTYSDTWRAAAEATSTGQLTMAKIMNAVTDVVGRGCLEDLVCLVSPKAFEVLNTDMAALRRLDSGYRHSKVDSGANSLCFYGMNGKLDIVPHLFVKQGDAFIFPPKNLVRIGSTEPTFKRPHTNGQVEIFREATSSAGFELRLYTAQALVPKRLSWMKKLSGITYA